MTPTSLPPARRAWLLIGLLVLASAGCTRRDWVSDMLVLVDVTGEWNGTVEWDGPRNFSWTLQQSGARVTGASSGSMTGSQGGQLIGRLTGSVNGDQFSFSIAGTGFLVQGVVTIDGDDMTGELIGAATYHARCPCRIDLRRSGPAPTPRPQT
jgi:hypothetical protein